MQFLAPSLLLGLLAAALPWLVHLIGKRRAVPVRFAAMELLLRSEKRVSARRRLREILLLIARTAIAAVLPLIFARPFTERPSEFPTVTFETQSAVIVLDDSASLRRERGGGTPLFEQAREKARSLLRQLPHDGDVALVLASEGTSPPVGTLTQESGRVSQALERVACSARPADFTGALRRASVILASSPRAKRRVYVITDLQATGWEKGTGLPPSQGPEVVIVDVGAQAPWENRGVVALTAEPAPEAGPGGLAVSAEIADFSLNGVKSLGVSLKIDGAEITRGFIDLAPGGRTPKRFVHALPAGSGTAHEVEVVIDNDAYPLDDRRLAHVELSRTVRALVLNGDSRTVRNEDEAFFLERALKTGDAGAAITTMLPDEAPLDGLSAYTAIYLLNVPHPSAALATALTRYVEAGGGLFISVGARVDATTWNERMDRLLPQPLGLARTASALPGQSAGEIVDDRPAERLAPIDRKHPLLASFAAHGEGLASARFFRYMLLEPVPDTVARSVVLRFESGAPALVERQVGKGRVLLLSTTIDREWTDLPIHPGYLPLMIESARRLVGASEKEGTTALLVGQPHLVRFGADDRRVEITRPDGSVWIARQEGAGAGRSASFPDTDEPGVYRVRAAGPDGSLAARPSDTFVVNVDPRESNPKRLPPELRPDRAQATTPGAPPPKQRIELWHGLAGLLIAFVLAESILTLRWRKPVITER